MVGPYQLEAELNGWTEKEKGFYLGVHLDGSTLKPIEKVDASSDRGFAQLVGALKQTTDQIALCWTWLQSIQQSPKENPWGI